MKRILINGAMAWVLAICLLAASCSAATLVNFTFNSAGSLGTVSGGVLISLYENISTVTINGVAYSGLTDQLTETSFSAYDVFTISGALNGALAGVTGNWLKFETQPSLATENGAGNFVVTYGAGTALDSISGALASNLGATFNTGPGGVSLGIGSGALIDNLDTVVSNVMFVMLPSEPEIPEPSSCLMLGTGLIVMFTARRRLFVGQPGQGRNCRSRTQFVSPEQLSC